MLLEIAIGDAYGAGFEYVDAKIIKEHNNLKRYVQHPRHAIQPGCYTDDTQMSIAIAQSILSNQPWSPELLANQFVETFKRDPREGYSGRFYEFLNKVQSGQQFLAEIEPLSDKSGASMRAVPIGIFPTIQQVIEKAVLQAFITHHTPDGINAAIATALSAHYFIYKLGKKQDLGKFLETHVRGDWAKPWTGKVGAKGWMSVRAAVTALMNSDRMTTLLRTCIDFTGDVDTVAAIALGAGACSNEIVQDLPVHLIDTLENGSYGRDYLRSLDEKFFAQFGLPINALK